MGMAGFGFLMFALIAIWIAAIVFWVMKLVEVCKISEYQYQAAGTSKTMWILIVVLAGWIGALVWHFAERGSVLAAARAVPVSAGAGMPVPPGWYPAGSGGQLRWWDGQGWR